MISFFTTVTTQVMVLRSGLPYQIEYPNSTSSSCLSLQVPPPDCICNLPSELVDELLTYLPRSDLMSFSLTCQTYRNLAQMALFRNITFSTLNQVMMDGLLSILGVEPRLCMFVRNVHFVSPDQAVAVCKGMVIRFAGIVSKLTRLTSVVISNHCWSPAYTWVVFRDHIVHGLPPSFKRMMFYVSVQPHIGAHTRL